jgi:Na+/H+ antiporter NhaD/arsenite permease-like protein
MARELGEQLGLWMILPFVGFLLCIAILPLVAGAWFDKNRNKSIVAAVFGLPVVIYLLADFGRVGGENILTTLRDYFSFLTLLASLFVISGGIYLTGNLLGTPRTNIAFLLVGAVLANLIGTTGAAMVLIRPLIRANSERKHMRHILIFFIFLVCNIGGLLTPLGDPPLFLGFLRGVSFFWTLRLFPQWLFTVGLTLLVFVIVELVLYRRETAETRREDIADYVPMRIAGKINLLFLLGVVLAVLFSGQLTEAGRVIHFPFLREMVMITMLALSLRFGPSGTRASNHFSWTPIKEVAIVFGGIFATMIPALAILEARGGEFGLTQPWQYFWSTGALSSFLDNAPTYLTFTATAQGLLNVDTVGGLMSSGVVPGIGQAPAVFLAAISAGAVCMGANSYIGNAPNFMVKSIAEHADVKMPSFFGYMLYSGVVLIPIFVLSTLIFYR